MSTKAFKIKYTSDALPEGLELLYVLPKGEYKFMDTPSGEGMAIYRVRGSGVGGPLDLGDTDPTGRAIADPKTRNAKAPYLDPEAPQQPGEQAAASSAVDRAIRGLSNRDTQGHARVIDRAAATRGVLQSRRAGAAADQIAAINTANRDAWKK
jgi:hypothetical protein